MNFLQPIHKILPRRIQNRLRIQKTSSDIHSLEQIRLYVEKNAIAASKGRECVDGRYAPDAGNGKIARPGGDFGYVMALMRLNAEKKLGLTGEECFEAVYRIVSKGDAFYMHTDHHADPVEGVKHDKHSRPTIGCGHIGKALLPENSKLYGVDPKVLFSVVEKAKQDTDRNIKIVNLGGEHGEEGVIIVNSRDKSINPHDEKHMYFVYDKLRDEEFMRNLVQKMKIDGLNFEDFQKASDEQLQAVLILLAKGLPIYTAEFTAEKARVTSSGTVGAGE